MAPRGSSPAVLWRAALRGLLALSSQDPPPLMQPPLPQGATWWQMCDDLSPCSATNPEQVRPVLFQFPGEMDSGSPLENLTPDPISAASQLWAARGLNISSNCRGEETRLLSRLKPWMLEFTSGPDFYLLLHKHIFCLNTIPGVHRKLLVSSLQVFR